MSMASKFPGIEKLCMEECAIVLGWTGHNSFVNIHMKTEIYELLIYINWLQSLKSLSDAYMFQLGKPLLV